MFNVSPFNNIQHKRHVLKTKAKIRFFIYNQTNVANVTKETIEETIK